MVVAKHVRHVGVQVFQLVFCKLARQVSQHLELVKVRLTSVVMTNAGPNQLFIAVLSPTVPLLLRGLDCSRQPPFPPRHSEKYKSMLIVDSNHMQPNASCDQQEYLLIKELSIRPE